MPGATILLFFGGMLQNTTFVDTSPVVPVYGDSNNAKQILAIVPTPDEIIGPGIAALVKERPTALKFINDGYPGIYGRLFIGLRGQAAEQINSLADYVKNGRLAFAEGSALKSLASSEFDSVENDSPQRAIGSVSIIRTTSTLSGVIPKGTRFRRNQLNRDLTLGSLFSINGWTTAIYRTVENVQINSGQTIVSLVVEAEEVGSSANTTMLPFPPGSATNQMSIIDPIFDTGFRIFQFQTAGGSDGVSDEDRRRYAKAFYTGQFAPDHEAIVAGLIKDGRVKKFIVRDDPTKAVTNIYIADSSWGSSRIWADATVQRLYDEGWIGFGCRVKGNFVQNLPISLNITVRLKRTQYLTSTTEILNSIQTKLRSYFDDRSDWDTWNINSIRAVVSKSDRRILSCTAASVLDPLGDSPYASGGVYASDQLARDAQSLDVAYHWSLIDNGVKVTFLGPT